MKNLPAHRIYPFSTKDNVDSSSFSPEDLEEKLHKLQQLQLEMQQKVNGHCVVQKPESIVGHSVNGQCKRTSLFRNDQNLSHSIPLVLSCVSPDSRVRRPFEDITNKVRRSPNNLLHSIPLLSCVSTKSRFRRPLENISNKIRRSPENFGKKDSYPPFPDDYCFLGSLKEEGFQRISYLDDFPPFPDNFCFKESLRKEGFHLHSEECNRLDNMDNTTCKSSTTAKVDENDNVLQHHGDCSPETELCLQKCNLSTCSDNNTAAQKIQSVWPRFFKNKFIGYSFANQKHSTLNGCSNNITNNNNDICTTSKSPADVLSEELAHPVKGNVTPSEDKPIKFTRPNSPDVPFEIFVRPNKEEKELSRKTLSVDRPIKFQEVSYEKMRDESRSEWTAREIYNLKHPFLGHQNARFFTVKIKSNPGGWYGTILMKALREKIFYIRHQSDVNIFRKEWDDNNGPLFVFLRHEPHDTNKRWHNGGILQIITKLKKLPEDRYFGDMGCQVKFVSTAVLDSDKIPVQLRSTNRAREVDLDVARQYIHHLISMLQEEEEECNDTCQNLFRLRQYIDKNETSEKTRKQTNGSTSCAFDPPPAGEEDWDLTLD